MRGRCVDGICGDGLGVMEWEVIWWTCFGDGY